MSSQIDLVEIFQNLPIASRKSPRKAMPRIRFDFDNDEALRQSCVFPALVAGHVSALTAEAKDGY
jgi:hypothetical protein